MPIALKRDRIAQLEPKYDLKPVPAPVRELPVKPVAPPPDPVAAALKTLLEDNRAGQLALLQAVAPKPSLNWEFIPTFGPKGIASVDCIKNGRTACTFVVHRDKAGKLTKLTIMGRE